MGKASGNIGHCSWNANEIGGKQWTLLMSGAEHNISSSCQELELVFKDIDRDSDIPCPIKIIRRLTVLEIALGQLRQDCEMISAKRRSIVQSVFADQSENVGQTEKILPMINAESSPDLQSEYARDKNWNKLSLEMKTQLDLLKPVAGR